MKALQQISGSLLHSVLLDKVNYVKVNRGGGVEPPTKFSKRGGGLTAPQLLEEGCWERGSDFFQRGGGLQFSHKK